jgi:hypothetical protein
MGPGELIMVGVVFDKKLIFKGFSHKQLAPRRCGKPQPKTSFPDRIAGQNPI